MATLAPKRATWALRPWSRRHCRAVPLSVLHDGAGDGVAQDDLIRAVGRNRDGGEAARPLDLQRNIGCATLFDLVVNGQLAHRGDWRLDAGAMKATKRPLGEGFAWDIPSVVDGTPFVAATLAAYEAAIAEDSSTFLY